MSDSGSDEDFWNVGGDDGPRPARRRGHTRRSNVQPLPASTAAASSIFLPILPERQEATESNDEDAVNTTDENANNDACYATPSDDFSDACNVIIESKTEERKQMVHEPNDEKETYESSFESDDELVMNSGDDIKNTYETESSSSTGENAANHKTPVKINGFVLDVDQNASNLPSNTATNITSRGSAEQKVPEIFRNSEHSPEAVDPSPCEFSDDGSVRRRKGKLIKWQSRSSTDIRTRSTSADYTDGPDALSRMSAEDDVGYPPRARLKNALYRGRRHLALRQGDEAVEEFVRGFALARIVHGDEHWRTCRCRVFLSQAYLYLKEFFPQAENEARNAKEILLRNLGTSLAPRKKLQVRHLLVVSALVEGEARLLQGRLDGATASLSRAHKHANVFEKKFNKTRRSIPASLRSVKPGDLLLHTLRVQAALLASKGRIPQAKEKLEDAVRRAEDIGGAHDRRLVLLLQQYGELLILNSQEQREKTKKLAQVSLDDLKLTTASPRSRTRERLASSYGQFPVRSNLKSSVSKSLSSNLNTQFNVEESGLESIDTEPIQDHARSNLHLGDDVTRGLAMLSRAVQITKAINRPGSGAELDARALLVRYKVTQGRYEAADALRELHSLYTVVSRAQGAVSCPALTLQGLTSQVLMNDKKFDEASEELRKMLSNTRNLYGDFSKQACQVLQQLWHVRALARDVPGLAEALSQLLSSEVLVYGTGSQHADNTRVKLRHTLQQLSIAHRTKLLRRHPELQVKPRFKNL